MCLVAKILFQVSEGIIVTLDVSLAFLTRSSLISIIFQDFLNPRTEFRLVIPQLYVMSTCWIVVFKALTWNFFNQKPCFVTIGLAGLTSDGH